MKTIRKVMAMLTAMVLMTILCAANVSAASVFDKAGAVEGGKKYSFKLSKSTPEKCFKIDIAEKGELVFKVESDAEISAIRVYDSNYTEIAPDNVDVTSGKYNAAEDNVKANSDTGKGVATYTYSVKKGTYYIFFKNIYTIFGTSYGKYSISITSPKSSSSDSKTEKSANTVKLTLNKGDKLGLGAMTGDKAVSSAKWSSSDDKVAKVDSKGNVTAVGAGSCRITWKTKSAEFSVYIEVASAKKSK